MAKNTFTYDLAGKQLTLETGVLAGQATSSVLARLGDTMVLVTIVAGKETELGYFPLSVEYVERLYAGGRIKGSRWVKREGRPTDEAILTGRLIDRSIRPLFPKEYKREVQIVITVLSVDGENEPDILSIIAVSAALHASPIPWNGPVSATRMGLVKENGNGGHEFIINPGGPAMELSELDLVATQTKEKTLMLEAGAHQVPEDLVFASIEKAHEVNKGLIAFIEDFAKKVGQPKQEVAQNTAVYDMMAILEKGYKKEIEDMAKGAATKESASGADDIIAKVSEQLKAENPEATVDKKVIAAAIEKVLYKSIRTNAIKNKKRPDGRKIDEIRPISAMVGLLPRTHGSAVFTRGTTQALTVATLGSARLSQLIETAEGEENKQYIHHYSMPPYSVGETGRIGTPSRREIGHGALAERALMPVIPKQEEFPYTIRLVSEIMSSNGSTSMASTCGSTLALMDAGVPIKNPVAGIAMGLMTDGDDYVVLTDILGLEDFSGDMDFKVAGTVEGVTAIQLDVKIPGITFKQIKETFDGAKKARLFILDKIKTVIPASRSEVSAFAPKIEMLKIPVEKIGELIGPGGRNIKNIIATTGAQVDVEDDGSVSISGVDEESVEKAVTWISGMTREVVPGEVFEEAEVKRILPFGAFVEFLPGKEGMVHVSKMSATQYVNNPSDVVQLGDKVKVRVLEIDDQGRVNLTMIFGEQNAPEGGEQPGPIDGGAPQGGFTPSQGGERPGRSMHPLSQQFRRERAGNSGGPRRGGFGGRSGGGFKRRDDRGGGGESKPRYRKSHY